MTLGNPTPGLKVLDALGSISSLQLPHLSLLYCPGPPELSHSSLAIPFASFHFMQASTQGQGRTVQRTEIQVQPEHDEMGAGLDITSPSWSSE